LSMAYELYELYHTKKKFPYLFQCEINELEIFESQTRRMV